MLRRARRLVARRRPDHPLRAAAEERAGSLGNAKLREAVARSRIERLTRREREVLSGVAAIEYSGERLIVSHPETGALFTEYSLGGRPLRGLRSG